MNLSMIIYVMFLSTELYSRDKSKTIVIDYNSIWIFHINNNIFS